MKKKSNPALKRKNNPSTIISEKQLPAEKSFLEHLEELRLRILWSLAAVFVAAIIAYVFADPLIRFFTTAIDNLVFIKPYEAFLLKIKVALFVGSLTALPIVFYHIWRFVTDALTPREKQTLLIYLPLSIGLFFLGALFSYQIIIPMSLHFFLSQSMPGLTPMISVNAYFSFFIWMVLVFGLVFQLPLLVFFLSRAGIITPEIIRKKRSLVIVIIFIAAALLTPPDVISQIMLAVPLWLLLEISIFVARIFQKK